MQHILTHTHNNTLFLQSAEIVEKALVSILDQTENTLLQFEMCKTNFFSTEIKLPKGHYSLLFEETNFSTKKNIHL